MSFIARRGLSTLVPPKVASPSAIGGAQDAARMQRVVSFYEKLPRGPAPEHAPKGLFGRYQVRYFGKNPSPAPIIHVIGFLLVLGYGNNYYFHLRDAADWEMGFLFPIGQPYEIWLSCSPPQNSPTSAPVLIQHAMANGIVPGVELKDLSSNWKKLQEKLANDTSRPPKRKAVEVLQPQHNGLKYRKFEPRTKKQDHLKEGTRPESKNMGLSWSSSKKGASLASLALWAEDNDIPTKDLAAAYGTSLKCTPIPDVKGTVDKINEGLSPTAEAGKYVAIDCEMVGVGPTPDTDSALARVSIVNYHGHQLYDSFVLPKEAITDYRTYVSGITPELLQEGRTLEVVQADVAKLLNGKILIGHAIKNDLSALLLGHSKRDIRDTSRHPAYRALAGGKTPSLKKLARQVLGVDIQGGEHSSIEDARATMWLFRREKASFESEHLKDWGPVYRREDRTADETYKGNSRKKKHRKKKKVRK